jgi:hypothetical protein
MSGRMPPKLAPQTSRRHHSVWQHRAWSTKGKIWCLRDGELFNPNTLNAAVEFDFYKIQKLTGTDLEIIKFFIERTAHEAGKEAHGGFVSGLLFPIFFMEHHRDKAKDQAQVDLLINSYRTEALEKFYSAWEEVFTGVLDRVRHEDIGFYPDDEDICIRFFVFLCTQYFRTKRMADANIKAIKSTSTLDFSRVWGILSYILAVNVGANLFSERKMRPLTLVRNDTEVAFLAGDQPVVNLDRSQRVSFYLPVSPRLALFLGEINEEPRYATDGLTVVHVRALNAEIAAARHSQLFADTQEGLLPFQRNA